MNDSIPLEWTDIDILSLKAYTEIAENYSQFDDNQKLMLKVDVEDILVSFPYNIEVQTQSSI